MSHNVKAPSLQEWATILRTFYEAVKIARRVARLLSAHPSLFDTELDALRREWKASPSLQEYIAENMAREGK